jgi:uncharacterized protein (TIGR03437 family)
MTRQNSCRYSRRHSLPFVLALGFLSASAFAQTLSVDNQTVNITAPAGGFASSTIHLSTTASTTVFVNTSNSPTWLGVSPTGPLNVLQGTPAPFNIIANAAGFTAGMMQTGTFTIGIQSSNGTPLTITVNLTVSAASMLTVSQPSLNFTVPLGTSPNNIPTQAVTVSSSGAAMNFNVTATTTDGNNWLVPVTTTGNTTSAAKVNIGVNPGNLPAGIYHGTVYVASTNSTDSASVQVTMTLTPPSNLSVTPTSLQPFLYQIGTVAQTGQLTRTVMVSSTNSSAGFTASLTSTVSWLIVSPPNGATGANGAAVPVTLTANPGNMASGVYNTALVIAPVGGTALTPIPVQLVISNNPLLLLSTNQLTFTSTFGATTQPPVQTVQITTLGTGNTSFSVTSDSSWLTATSGTVTTPATLNVSVNPTGLAIGPYTGTITVRPTGADANLYSLPITVNLSVGSTTTISAGPPLIVFSAETTLPAPTAQLVQLTANGQPITFALTTSTTSAANCPGSWLSATTASNSVSSTAPATITVNAATTNMTPGTCSGTVTVTYPASGSNPSTLTIPVTVNVSTTAPLLTINMPLGFGQFTAVQGGQNIASTITLGSTDGTAVPFGVTSNSNGPSPWLFVGTNGSTAPQVLQVQIVPGNLAPNTYSGSITITSTSLPSSPVTIPITLTVTSSVTVTLSNTGPLNFAQTFGGPLPAVQTTTMTSSGSGASFQTTIPSTTACSWLVVSPTSGPATGNVTFTPQTNSLPQSTYTCPVTFSFIGTATAPITVNAVLTVGPAQSVTVSSPNLSFTYQVGGATPASQSVTISSTGGPVNFTVGTTSTGGWLITDAGTGTLTTPKTINVSINPANIPSGAAGSTISGAVSISAPGVLSNPIGIQVSLTVAAPLVPTVVSIFNSATGALGNGIAPGELITLKGINLGPAVPAGGTSFTAAADGTVSNTLVGVQVSFSGILGTPTFVSSSQINVIVPWEMAGRTSTNIIVLVNNVQSTPIAETVVAVAPGVYTLTATGQGQAAALNSNPTGTINGPVGGVVTAGGTIPTTPGVQGSIIAVYGTGGGLTNPQGIDGTLNSGIFLMPILNWTPGSNVVTATVGGKPATVNFAGAAPTLITGVWQINITLPTGLSSGPQPLVITIAGQQTQSNVTVAVQ